MRKISVSLPSFDLNNATSVANVLCNLESNDSQMEMAINELVNYVYILESMIRELQFKLDVFEKAKDALIIMEELSKDVD